MVKSGIQSLFSRPEEGLKVGNVFKKGLANLNFIVAERCHKREAKEHVILNIQLKHDASRSAQTIGVHIIVLKY